jgi:calmodulin
VGVTQEERQQLREAFEAGDSDGNGKIDFVEFVAMLERLGADLDAAKAQFGFEAVDTDGDGMIDFDEFVEWWRAT